MSKDEKATWKVGESHWSGFSRSPRHLVYRETSSGRVGIASFVKKKDAEKAAGLVNMDFAKAELALTYRMGTLLGRARCLIGAIAETYPDGSDKRKVLQEWLDEVDVIRALAPPKKEGKPDAG